MSECIFHLTPTPQRAQGCAHKPQRILPPFLGPHSQWRAPTEALHGGIQSLGILAGIKVWEIMNGAAVLGTLWREKQRVSC